MKTKKELKKECDDLGIEYTKKEVNTSLMIKIAEKLAEKGSETTQIEEKVNPVEESARFIDTIIIHCSDSDVPAHDDIEVIRGWHVNERGWRDVGYHFFIKSDGTIQNGRELGEMGAHAKGYNTNSIGICVHGKRLFSAAGQNALASLINKLLVKIGTITKIIGHNEVSTKTCPNFRTKRFKQLLKNG